MRLLRSNHINNRITITRPKVDGPDGMDLEEEPTVSMVFHNGILHIVDGHYESNGWTIQIFESRNPIVNTDAKLFYQKSPWFAQPAYGRHNVLVATIDKTPNMQEYERWANLLVAAQDRIRWLYDQAKVGYVMMFADMRPSDIPEPHLQLVTLPVIPPTIKTEIESSRDIKSEMGICPMCQIVDEETGGKRQILTSKNFIAICPWPPSRSYEFWIVPRKHSVSFLKLTQVDLHDLAMLMWSTLGGLTKTLPGVSFSLAFHLSPEKKKTSRLHWHIEVYPHTSGPAGMDMGFGVSLCNVSPEDAAKDLSVASRREWIGAVGVNL